MNPWNQIFQPPPVVSGGVLNPAKGWFSIIKPIARTNEITNPSAETNTTNYTAGSGTLTRSTEQQYHGAYSLKYVPTSSADDGFFYGTISTTAGQVRAISCKWYGAPGVRYKLSVATTGGVDLVSKKFVATGRWQWIWLIFKETSTTTRRIYFTKDGHNSTSAFYIDGVQSEVCNSGEVFPTTYIDGDQLSVLPNQFPRPYGWNGTRHASTSFRTANTRDGGRVMSLDFFKFLLVGVIGLGMVKPTHIALTQPLSDGARFQTSLLGPRDFILKGRLNTDSYVDRDQQLTALFEAMNLDATSFRQPLALLYQRYDGLVAKSQVGKIIASYRQGFEGALEGPVGEDINAQFTVWLPTIIGSEEGTTITVSETIATGANRETFFRNDAGDWSLLDNTVNSVLSMDRHPDGSIYLVGDFTSYAGTSANRIIRFDPATSTFSALGTGLNGIARCVRVGPSGKIYVGGDFTTAGGTTVNRVAQWDPITSTWAALGAGATKGVDNTVFALDLDRNENLYVTGTFLNAGGAGANRIAKWTNSTNAWSALGTGLNSDGNGLAVGLDDTVYVHGAFTTANGVSCTRIAHWTGSTFEPMGSGVSSQPSNNTLRVDPRTGRVFTGGAFVTAGGVTVNGIAVWNGGGWQALGTGVAGASASVDMIEFAPDGLMYVAGSFTQVNGITTSDAFAAWNGSSWVLPDIDIPGTANAVGMGFTTNGGMVIFFDNSNVGNASAAQVNTVRNNGKALAYPIVHLTGASGGASRLHQIRSYTTGLTSSFNLTVSASEEVDIIFTPTGTRVISWVRGDISDTVLSGAALTQTLLPGDNSVTVFATGTTPTVTMRWAKQYQSIAELAD